ncbi:hypothetical protein [Streptomyces sp. AS02]|uniref:hypothetical protein n=1 Tax=Streptomyces sp. AS02 TaxID=2938946 RepID=UPI0020212D9C|nr:hypothetical protein [Streptomyces sp. AS02]MCL8014645.1 hypothetical protein [Streptomyces sp. AS02]
MIPRIDLKVDPSFPEGVPMGMPAEDEVSEEGYGFFRGVWDISGVTHEEARAIVEEERGLAHLVDQVSTTPEEFEDVADAVESGDPDSLPAGFAERHPDSEILEIVGDGDREEGVLDGLEIGVAGLSFALSSIGCFPAASCRSHASGRSWSDRPVVYFAAERLTVHWLTPMVRDSGCGFGNGSDRGELLFVEAPSISNLMELANQILDKVERQSPNR